MHVIDLTDFDEEFVLHFGGDFHRINAETFAGSILEITAALKEINRVVNPTWEIEIYVDAIGQGSFRARIKTIKSKVAPLLDGVPKAIIVGLLTTLIYEKIVANNSDVNIIINDDSYIVEADGQQIVLPRDAEYEKKKVSENPEVDKRISKAFQIMEKDQEIRDFGITKKIDDSIPDVSFPRSDFPRVAEIRENILIEENSRIKDERTDLLIIRAIFERGSRKWQFVWRDGIKISAPVLDETFFDKLKSHEYVIGTGDSITALLRIHQTKDELSGVWMNEKYEVVEVFDHSPAEQQDGMDFRR